ncbi:MAG: hypothetical protein HXY40_18905 [Chloroflexi bacterium]|nr:hypothetical protein [Chloroflexota bacterium]
MIEQLAAALRPFLELPMVRRTRRNHGLEHATIHVLSGRVKNLRMSGRSTDAGFFLFGDVPTEMIENAARDALRRMRGGEHGLALHPNCGTNYVTAGALTTFVALLTMGIGPRRSVLERVPLVMLLMILAVLFAQPLGMSLQKHITTEGDPGDLEIVEITRRETRLPLGDQTMIVHTVRTQSS